ncbi:hypothetical protein E2C01_028236 [Portunus trituberculatus]|uniref:Uncharacterized protein n=1 Tax=Portunus trituberculatus TaxID=210409 RepID=A0A5B7EPG9_PORTR|nr:hypothetical protein [Portunus trituberculatus]
MQIMKKNRTTLLAIVPTNGILEHILARQLSAHRERLHPSGRACRFCRRATAHLARPAAGVGGDPCLSQTPQAIPTALTVFAHPLPAARILALSHAAPSRTSVAN